MAVTSPEQARLAHLGAEQHARDAAVPAARPPAAVPDHAAEVMAAHEGRPTVAEQQNRECYP